MNTRRPASPFVEQELLSQRMPPMDGFNHPPSPDLTRKRLPALDEVLNRTTTAPVDLFSFYIFMRDQQRSVDYLDFWLDVAQHMTLCRHYVRELRRSVMIGTPDAERAANGGSKRSSQILESIGDIQNPMAGPSYQMTEKTRHQDAQMSAFLREESANGHSPQNSFGSASASSAAPQSSAGRRPSLASNNNRMTSGSNSPDQTVTRADIRASAEKILYTYLLPGAEREITLPETITQDITVSIEEHGRDDPEVFDAAKDYVFQAMERDAFPAFLRLRALGNLIPQSILLRLVVGLLSMFGGWWAAFVLIFLNDSRKTRAWLVLPFTIGVYMLMTTLFNTDPIIAIAGYSEYTLMSFARIREPYVRKLVITRSVMILTWMVATDAALCCLFILVPGKRL